MGRAHRLRFIRSFDLYSARLFLTPSDNTEDIERVSTWTARSIRKFNVDRLGRLSVVRGEALTWRGQTIEQRGPAIVEKETTSLREVA